jgi:chemotaxis protein MotB
MNRPAWTLVATFLLCAPCAPCGLCGCGVSKSEYDSKAQEADDAKKQVAQLQTQLASDEQQISQLKGSLGMAQSQAMTDDQKAQLDGTKALAEVAGTLRTVGAKRFQVAGHTDTQPITTDKKKEFPTNWELSTARAIAVVKLLTAQGVDPATLSAAGYGPYDPVASNATPDGMAKNRRIEITLVPNVAELVKEAQTAPPASAAPAPVASASAAPVASH